jgi:diguanylate cyclase (GGDEF)-like protein
MYASKPALFVLASNDPALLATVEPVLLATDADVRVFMNAQAALDVLNGEQTPALAVIDENLPGMPIGQLLAAARAKTSGHGYPIVLVTDDVTQEWYDRLVEGVLDDVILRSARQDYWQLRIDLVRRTQRMSRELDALREASSLHAQQDRLTGVYNREAILSILFRETDRAQRMKSPLCLILFDIDDFGHWNERLGAEMCDQLLCMVVERTQKILRSYDVLGRPGKDEFLIMLPGCATANALMLAERQRLDVFSEPFRVSGESIRLSACFGVATSMGRSPVVVLREAEQALQWAKDEGPESIQFFGDSDRPLRAPVTYISPSSGDELLAW